jgi:hypothetical protein
VVELDSAKTYLASFWVELLKGQGIAGQVCTGCPHLRFVPQLHQQ